MNIKHIMGLCISAALIALGRQMVIAGDIPEPVIQRLEKKAEKKEEDLTIPATSYKPGEFCSDVIEKCVAKVELVSESCNKNEAKEEVEGLLRLPLENVYCEDIDDRLNGNCQSGCSLDLLAKVIVRGATQFEWTAKRDQAGVCRATGTRPVTVRGSCVGDG